MPFLEVTYSDGQVCQFPVGPTSTVSITAPAPVLEGGAGSEFVFGWERAVGVRLVDELPVEADEIVRRGLQFVIDSPPDDDGHTVAVRRAIKILDNAIAFCNDDANPTIAQGVFAVGAQTDIAELQDAFPGSVPLGEAKTQIDELVAAVQPDRLVVADAALPPAA